MKPIIFYISDIPDLVNQEIQDLQLIVNAYPHISEKVNVKHIQQAFLTEFQRQVNKHRATDKEGNLIDSKLGRRPYIHDTKTTFEGIDTNEFEQVRRSWIKFKRQYLIWAKNLIARLNRIRLMEKASWLDVRALALVLTKIAMSESVEFSVTHEDILNDKDDQNTLDQA